MRAAPLAATRMGPGPFAPTADEMDGSHCVALSRPKELADRLEAYRAEL